MTCFFLLFYGGYDMFFGLPTNHNISGSSDKIRHGGPASWVPSMAETLPVEPIGRGSFHEWRDVTYVIKEVSWGHLRQAA